MVLAVADNGVGLPTNFDYHQARPSVCKLVTALVEQLSASWNWIEVAVLCSGFVSHSCSAISRQPSGHGRVLLPNEIV